MLSFKQYIIEGYKPTGNPRGRPAKEKPPKEYKKPYLPTDLDYDHVYTQRRKGNTDRRIVMGDDELPPLGISQWATFRTHFDSDQAKQRPNYHPPAADNRSRLTDTQYNQVYRLRYSGHPETHIQKTMGIHKDTIAKYIDSDEAKGRPNYHPPVRKLK